MAGRKHHRLGDLQLKIMKVLWERNEASVAEIHAAVGKSAFAYTTIATMLRKMEVRGLVRHRAAGRCFIYRAAVNADAVTRSMSEHLLDRLFSGSLADLVCHLLDTREIAPDELVKLERLIAERKKRQ